MRRAKIPRQFRSRDTKALEELERAERQAIIVKYARLFRSGKPVQCAPSQDELQGFTPRKQGVNADWKIIYDTQAQAEAAELELRRLPGGMRQRAYECRRGHGHWHLTAAKLVVRPPKVDRGV